jgi:nucleotide-binding universal stress UspA family protein
MLQDLIVGLNLNGGKKDVGGAFAVSLAKAFELEISAASFAFVPVYPATTPMELFGVDFVGSQRSENETAAQRSIADFTRLSSGEGIKASSQIIEGGVADASRQFSNMARCYDLAVVEQAMPEHWEADLVIEAALFESGRPLIVVPYIYAGPLKLDHATICWDGGRPAARAVADSRPLLQRAKKVDVLSVALGVEELPAESLLAHLKRHGINANSVVRSTQRSDEANLILNHAADAVTDLIVMGGYGHTRLREFVLGGVTRTMLRSMTAPVLLSH